MHRGAAVKLVVAINAKGGQRGEVLSDVGGRYPDLHGCQEVGPRLENTSLPISIGARALSVDPAADRLEIAMGVSHGLQKTG